MCHFVPGQWGAVCGNPTSGPVEPTLGMRLGTVFTRACFSWGRLYMKGKSSSSGNTVYLSQILLFQLTTERDREGSWPPPRVAFVNLAHLCLLAIMDCCEDVKAAGHLGTLKLIHYVPLPICCFLWCMDRQESKQCVRSEHKKFHETLSVMFCPNLAADLGMVKAI